MRKKNNESLKVFYFSDIKYKDIKEFGVICRNIEENLLKLEITGGKKFVNYRF